MVIDLITLVISPHSFDLRLTPEEINLDGEDAQLKTAVEVKGAITKHIAQVDVEGHISADVELNCTRCLTAIEKRLEFPFEAAYVTAENYKEAKEAELSANDLDVSVFEGDKIDLTELVREQILLNLPGQVFAVKTASVCAKNAAQTEI